MQKFKKYLCFLALMLFPNVTLQAGNPAFTVNGTPTIITSTTTHIDTLPNKNYVAVATSNNEITVHEVQHLGLRQFGDGHIKVWNSRNGYDTPTDDKIAHDGQPVRAIAYQLSDGGMLISAGDDRNVHKWHINADNKMEVLTPFAMNNLYNF